MHARSKVCYSGVAISGLVDKTFGIRIAGVSKKHLLQRKLQFSVTTQLDGGPSTTTFLLTDE
jgi:hypothetical protein